MQAPRRLAAALLSTAMLSTHPSWSAPTIHVIVDDEDGPPGFTLTGNDWAVWNDMAGYGFDASDTRFHYLSHTVGGSDRRGTATWTPDLPCAGTYQVSTWFRMTGNRTHDADHFVYDGNGDSSHFVIDQYGDGASGWVPLGEHFCGAGLGGCAVVLDGTDDDESDEANAVRFTLVECRGDPDDNVPVCPEASEPGVHTVTGYAHRAWASGGWSNAARAVGTADGELAVSPNLDDGENLYGADWGLCNPPGDETILKVEIGSLGKTQYDSGSYDVLVELSAGGTSSTSWHHTDLAWDDVDVTADSATWGWFDVQWLTAQVGLGAHPGGNNDADVWVDAFRVQITYESHEPGGAGGAAGAAQGGAGGGPGGAGGAPGGAGGSDGATGGRRGDVGADAPDDEGCACRASSRGPSSAPSAIGILALLALRCRRRRTGHSHTPGR